MNEIIKVFLKSIGYEYNSNALEKISECDDWYSNEPISHFHDRKGLNGQSYNLLRLNFAKRGCSDDANLCEVVEIAAGTDEKTVAAVNDILVKNNFDTMYRQQLELVPALGTAAGYISLENAELKRDGSLKNGKISINYVRAEGFYPLTVVNNEVTEAAFAGEQLIDGKSAYTVVVFKLENGKYVASTYHLDDKGKELPELTTLHVQLGEVKPFFVMRNAEVNNLRNMQGYGLPKVYNAIPVLKVLDLAYNILFSDLDKGEKILLINDLLCQMDKDGKPYMTPEQKKLFIMIGEKLPDQKELIFDYNPEIRIEQITKIFETALSLLSMTFGYGTKKYTFENGKITTATEYAGTKQDSLQELNKQRYEATQYIRGIVNAVIWFSNTFNGAGLTVPKMEDITIDYDDTYITDKEAELQRKHDDALSFDIPILLVWYLMDAYNITEDEAKKYIAESKVQDEPKEPEED